MNVERSMKRTTGWVLLFYGYLWGGYWMITAPAEPAPLTIKSVGSFLVFFGVLAVLLHYGYEFLSDTGGLFVDGEGP